MRLGILNKVLGANGPRNKCGVTSGSGISTHSTDEFVTPHLLLVTPHLLRGPFVVLFTLLSLLSQLLHAQNTRSTSFDNRGICEETKGVWRQFGNGCADECESKFDRYTICTQALVYGCECGKGRCWDGKSCVALIDYKEIFDKRKKAEQKILDAAKEKRRAQAQANRDAIILKLTPPPPVDPTQIPLPDATSSNPTATPSTPAPTVVNPVVPTNPISEVEGTISFVPTPAATPTAPTTQVEIPPFLLKKQAQEAAQQKEKDQQTNDKTQSKPETSTFPGLPEIPLPN